MQDPPLDIDNLSAFVNNAGWMRKHRSPWRRLLYRLAVAHLELLTEKAMAGEQKRQWAKKVRKEP